MLKVYLDQGKLGSLEKGSDLALMLSQELGDRPAEMEMEYELGYALLHRGKIAQGVEHYEQALKIARETEDLEGEALITGALATAYFEHWDIEQL